MINSPKIVQFVEKSMVKSEKEFVPNSLHYLDFAGAALPTPKFLQRIANLLSDSRECFLANPHSGHLMGRRTRDKVQIARAKILAHFGAKDPSTFAVIFTSNATNALKLLAENFGEDFCKNNMDYCGKNKQFSNDLKCLKDDVSLSTLLMLRDSHTSVVGMRNVDNFEQIVVVDYDELYQFLTEMQPKEHLPSEKLGRKKKCLFVMTAMSNFCGRVYDITMANRLKRVLGSHWFVCVDSAALAPHSSDIGLSFCDFAVISFYKMFGYPSGNFILFVFGTFFIFAIFGIGALIVRRSSAHCLQKNGYFGGGTVKFASPISPKIQFRNSIEERFEDGTCNFHAISALSIAFEESEKDDLGHSMNFAERAFDALCQMKHPNGAPIAIVYGKGWNEHKKIKSSNNCAKRFVQGPIVNFNLLRDDGSFVGFVEVDKMADLFGIQLRIGCHCNLGACGIHLGISEQMMAIHYQQNGKECGDELDLFEGKPLGSVRISFGRTSSEEDLCVFLQMLSICFCGPIFPFSVAEFDEISKIFEECDDQKHRQKYPIGLGTLTHLFVYPIKSCAAMAKKSWPLCPSSGSLLFDRHWMIVSCGGDSLTQKRCSALCFILPEINANGNELLLKERNNALPEVRIATKKRDNWTEEIMANHSKSFTANGAQCLGRRKQSEFMDFGGESVSLWLSELDPFLEGSKMICCSVDETNAASNFSNKANFLLISRASALFIASRVSLSYESVVARFRPNFVVDFGPKAKAFEEENIEQLAIGSVEFIAVGICQRCQMICIDQKNGQKDPNVLIALRNLPSSAAAANDRGKLSFGIYLEVKAKQIYDGKEQTKKINAMAREIQVGCSVCVLKYKKEEFEKK